VHAELIGPRRKIINGRQEIMEAHSLNLCIDASVCSSIAMQATQMSIAVAQLKLTQCHSMYPVDWQLTMRENVSAHRVDETMILGVVEGTGLVSMRPCDRTWQLLQRRPRRFHLRFHLLGPLHNDRQKLHVEVVISTFYAIGNNPASRWLSTAQSSSWLPGRSNTV
jgi:hypothetical protein